MSLAARFSNSAYFTGIAQNQRGEIFAKEAQSIYADATRQGEDFSPSLHYLQGCILLAFYHNTNASNSFGWTLTGVCARLAYDLGIDLVDEDICDDADSMTTCSNTADDWVLREELRRAWWSVWELDTFASTVARRPYTIDRAKMYVLLPVSDESWFNEQPGPSAPLGHTPVTAWRSLQGSQNQDERAWFLVANFLMSLAYDLKATKSVSLQSKAEMESALDCFSLSLPVQFRTTTCSFVFTDSTFARSNWIITTNIILQRCVMLMMPGAGNNGGWQVLTGGQCSHLSRTHGLPLGRFSSFAFSFPSQRTTHTRGTTSRVSKMYSTCAGSPARNKGLVT